ncbi:EscU/YscU/HrcU family type III secretion system export apparatus switch protein [SAR92 clade bacterium H921]|jgi:flagellar biosynthesis protein|nr:EscU/YscU/HrcU family type III secretion system export apparatus switch protein [SAR92 clade bacterium H921]MDG0972342.1 EscU/YscU/HrcU family type III secretion system export apparatus switch protein [Porticoccaceae bacterium]MDG1307806.1 EscU/YscU/HrcU family type III secretion system export apparatus switch protein [Porticoccaceae bacterium]
MTYKPLKKAIALEYGKNPAPVLTAKGEGEMAEQIIAEAKKRGIHIAEDAQLVGLLSQLKLDDEIPENLYVAVAVILSWVYWLKGMEPEKK